MSRRSASSTRPPGNLARRREPALYPCVSDRRPIFYRACDSFPVNTHGGLMAFGAPWEVPAMYNIIEACEQLEHKAGTRQVQGARRALVYGNGGIFSHSAVAILAAPVD